MSFYLAIKEIWRYKGRFLLFSLVIALITVLVLFMAALAQGLAAANKEYLEKLNANLIVFQEKVKLSTLASRIGTSLFNDIRRVPGVMDAGLIGFSNGTIVFPETDKSLDVSLIGVLVGKPGMPPVFSGRTLRSNRGYQVIIDSNVVARTGLQVGEKIIIKTFQGTQDEFHEFTIAGITDGRQYFFQPAVFIPLDTWDTIRPQPEPVSGQSELVVNVVAVQLDNPSDMEGMADSIEKLVGGVEVVDLKTAYEATPGYQAQQSTLNTQQGFTLLIGILVIGGFFQIQTLQKVPQLGVLKAIGTSNNIVAGSVIFQIIFVTISGVMIGAIGTYVLSLFLPVGIPIIFAGRTIGSAIIALLIIGPLGGLVSVRLAVKAEPLRALGM